MSITLDGTSGITTPDVDSGPVSGTNFSYTGTLTGGTGVVNLGSGQVYKDASGNVGIGTSSPSYKLDVVKASAGSAVRIWDNTDSSPQPTLYLQRGTNATWGADAYTDYKLMATAGTFTISGGESGVTTERMRIDSSGNLLVGVTATPSGSIGGAGFIRESAGRSTLYCAVTSTGTAGLINFYNPNGNVGYIATSGTSTSYVTSSDYRLKHDIAPMTGALARVAALKPVTYKWNIDDSQSQGFIAHELQEVVPECVTGEKDAVDAEGNPQYQGIDTSFLVATLTAAIQEQQAIINAQQAALESLTARVVALEGQA